jgi:hypothetical protein
MSAQALNIMLADLFRSEEALARYQQDPDTVARQYNLTQEGHGLAVHTWSPPLHSRAIRFCDSL